MRLLTIGKLRRHPFSRREPAMVHENDTALVVEAHTFAFEASALLCHVLGFDDADVSTARVLAADDAMPW
jgi:hypothetical protein